MGMMKECSGEEVRKGLASMYVGMVSVLFFFFSFSEKYPINHVPNTSRGIWSAIMDPIQKTVLNLSIVKIVINT